MAAMSQGLHESSSPQNWKRLEEISSRIEPVATLTTEGQQVVAERSAMNIAVKQVLDSPPTASAHGPCLIVDSC